MLTKLMRKCLVVVVVVVVNLVREVISICQNIYMKGRLDKIEGLEKCLDKKG